MHLMLIHIAFLSMHRLVYFLNRVTQLNYVLMSIVGANVLHGKHHTNLFHNLNNMQPPKKGKLYFSIKFLQFKKFEIFEEKKINFKFIFLPQFHHNIDYSIHRSSTMFAAYVFHSVVVVQVENF